MKWFGLESSSCNRWVSLCLREISLLLCPCAGWVCVNFTSDVLCAVQVNRGCITACDMSPTAHNAVTLSVNPALTFLVHMTRVTLVRTACGVRCVTVWSSMCSLPRLRGTWFWVQFWHTTQRDCEDSTRKVWACDAILENKRSTADATVGAMSAFFVWQSSCCLKIHFNQPFLDFWPFCSVWIRSWDTCTAIFSWLPRWNFGLNFCLEHCFSSVWYSMKVKYHTLNKTLILHKNHDRVYDVRTDCEIYFVVRLK